MARPIVTDEVGRPQAAVPVLLVDMAGSAGVIEPGTLAAAVAPSDTVDLPTPAKALYIGGAGNVVLVPLSQVGNAGVTFANVPAGSILPMRCRCVLATGTTATLIVAITA